MKSLSTLIALSLLINSSGAQAGNPFEELGKGLSKLGEEAGKVVNKTAEETGKVLNKTGQEAGKVVNKTVEETAKVVDKTLKETGNAVKDTTETIRTGQAHGDIAKAVEENKDAVAAVAIIAAVGWAACMDGCTVVGSLLAGGAAIPVVAVDMNDKKTQKPSGESGNVPGSNTQTNNNPPDNSTYKPNYEQQYPKGFSRFDFPNGVPPVLVYRSTRDDLGKIFNEFAFPTTSVVVRYPGGYDSAGGQMESPRNDMSPAEREHYGPDARRVHAGIDFLTFPGDAVFAPMTGTIESVQPMSGKNGLQMITIRAKDGTLARSLYVAPNDKLAPGLEVKAGKTEIGRAQNIGVAYNLNTTPNHIHVDYTDHEGRRFDPWTNKVVDKRKFAP